MWKNHRLTINKRPNFEKLIQYGFIKKDNIYLKSINIFNDMFMLNIYVNLEEETFIEVIDKEINEEYSLVYVESTVGSFVGNIRIICEEILQDIVNNCYEKNYYKSIFAKQMMLYVKEKYNSSPEYLWEETSTNAIFRNKINNKWYIVLLMVEKRKLGIDEDGVVEIINLKETQENISNLIDNKKYFKGFHMNKKHWYTMCLDGSVTLDDICKRIDISYDLVNKKF